MRICLSCLFSFAVGCCSTPVYSQTTGTVRGSVSLASNKAPLHHATVNLVQLNRTTQTDNAGLYQFTNVPPGRYDVIAHMHALSDVKQTIDVSSGSSIEANFSLGVAPLRQEITVTASGREETTLETFQSVIAVQGYELSTRASAPALGEMLEQEAGIAKRSSGPGTSRPVIRGFDGDRVLVLQDGARTGTLSSQSGDHGEPVEATSLERIEVVRGPATLLYGSNAIGGVVNVITRHHELDEHPHSGVRAGITALAGSGNGLGGGSGNFEFGLGNYLIWGSGGGQRTGDYKTSAGTIQNSFSNLRQAAIGIGRYGEKRFWTLNYGLQDGTYGVPTPPPSEAGDESEPVDLDWRRHNVRFHGGFRNMTGWLDSFRATLNYSDWNHKEIEAGEIGTRFFNKQFTWQGMFQQARKGILSGTFGGWGLVRDFETQGEEALAPPVRQNAVAAFAMEELRFERFRLQFGGRLEHNRYATHPPAFYDRETPDRSFTGASGAAGIYIPATKDGAVVFNYTTSFRAPALEELYNLGPHFGNLAFEIGNPNLRRERGQGIDLSIRKRTTKVHTELNLYRYWISDFVYLAPTGTVNDGLIEAAYSQADTRYIGTEARVDVALHPSLWLNLGFDAVDAQIRYSHTPLPRIPPLRGRIGVDYHRAGWSIRPEIALVNRQWQTFPTETATAGYAVTNLMGSYVIGRQHVSHAWSVNLFNAGDRLYRNHLSLLKDFAPEIGRGVRFSYTINIY